MQNKSIQVLVEKEPYFVSLPPPTISTVASALIIPLQPVMLYFEAQQRECRMSALNVRISAYQTYEAAVTDVR